MTWLESLQKHKNVKNITTESNLITIITNDSRPPLRIYKNSNESMLGIFLKTLLKNHNFHFLLNFKKNYYLDCEAISLLKENRISFGDAADIFRILNDKEISYSEFLCKDSEYILQNLNNHFNIKSYALTSNRKIHVIFHNGKSINFVFINDYAITQARINEICFRYSPFDFILAANPNAHFQEYQYQGKSIQIGYWADLFRFLGKFT